MEKKRKSIRLKEYDYSQPGGYFVTIVTQGRLSLLGEVIGGAVELSQAGQAVLYWWHQIPRHFDLVECDQFVIMPNHIHGIIIMHENAGLTAKPRPWDGKPELMENPGGRTTKGLGPSGKPWVGKPWVGKLDPYDGGTRPRLGQVVAYFKYQSTKQINAHAGCPGRKIWQRNYYERVLRNDDELNRAREYIFYNPLRWEMDRENLAAPGELP